LPSRLINVNHSSVVTLLYSVLLACFLFQIFDLINPIIFTTIDRFTYPIPFKIVLLPIQGLDDVLFVVLAVTLLLQFVIKQTKWWMAISVLVGSFVMIEASIWIPLDKVFPMSFFSAPLTFVTLLLTVIKRDRTRIRWQMVPVYFVCIIIVVEVLSIGTWLMYDVSRGHVLSWLSWIQNKKIIANPYWKASELSLKIFGLFGITPIVVLLISFSYLIRIMISQLNISTIRLKSSQIFSNFFMSEELLGRDTRTYIKKEKLLIAIGFMLSIFLPILAYVGEENKVLGVDVNHYDSWISQITHGASSLDMVHKSFTLTDGDRPLTFMLIVLFEKATGIATLNLLRYLPVLLGPLLIASVWYATRVLFSNRRLESLVVISTALTIQEIVGIYAGLYANWFALIFAFVMVAFMYKLSSKPNSKIFVVALISSSALLLAHSETWIFFAGMLIVFLGFSYFVRWKYSEVTFPTKSFVLIGLIILSGMVLDLAISQTFQTPVALKTLANHAEGVDTAANSGMSEFGVRWQNLNLTYKVYLGGYLDLSFLFIPIFLWTLQTNYKTTSNRLLLSWIYISSIPLIFSTSGLQSRLLYDTPFQIMLFLGLLGLQSRYKNLLIIFANFTLLDYALRAISNLVLKLPT
jgi:hypothetical protein